MKYLKMLATRWNIYWREKQALREILTLNTNFWSINFLMTFGWKSGDSRNLKNTSYTNCHRDQRTLNLQQSPTTTTATNTLTGCCTSHSRIPPYICLFVMHPTSIEREHYEMMGGVCLSVRPTGRRLTNTADAISRHFVPQLKAGHYVLDHLIIIFFMQL